MRVEIVNDEDEVERLLELDEIVLQRIKDMKEGFIRVCSRQEVHETGEEALAIWRGAKRASRDYLRKRKLEEANVSRKLLAFS